MSRAWINDRWLTDARVTTGDGSVVRVPPPAAVKRALSMHMDDPGKAKVPAEYRTTAFGKGRGGPCSGPRTVSGTVATSGTIGRPTSSVPVWRTTSAPTGT